MSVLTRSAEKAKGLPAGVQPVTGNLLDVATVRSAFKGMEGVFLLNPVGASEGHARGWTSGISPKPPRSR